ncbi:MAG: hypothetical protein E6X95_18095 [Thomasclavelia ramosa]|nr:hypothetical protein [Thomasclavelia ramosa]
MVKETNITIRCSEETKTLFNTIAKENPQFSKGDLFELMIKAYITLQEINRQITGTNDLIKENIKGIKETKAKLNEVLNFINMKNIDH